MKKNKVALISVLTALIWFGCSYSIAEEAAPTRIISLAPATTEILFALGLDKEIIGVSSFCDYPSEALGKEKVGTFSSPSIEKIISLEPDLVVGTGLEQAPAIKTLEGLRLKVYVSNPSSIRELFGSIEDLGALTHRKKEAYALVTAMQQALQRVRGKTASIPLEKRPKVFVEIWNDPLITAGNGSFVEELITLAGGANIAHDAPRPYSRYSAEQVLVSDPDVIIMAYMAKERPVAMVQKRAGWQHVSAVKNNRVYNDIDSDVLLRPGPRLIEGLMQLQEKLYP